MTLQSNSQTLQEIIGSIPLKKVVVKEELNTLFKKEGQEGILRVIREAKEEKTTRLEDPTLFFLSEEVEAEKEDFFEGPTENLTVFHENKLLFQRTLNRYYVLGTISQDLGSMFITLMVEELDHGRKERTKIDLYEREQVKTLSEHLALSFYQNTLMIEEDLALLTDLLEKHREDQLELVKHYHRPEKQKAISSPEKVKCIEFLSKSGLINRIDQLIGQAGVVGEENTRKLLFVIASTYKMSDPLHALVQGTSGSGKSHLINSIGSCLPQEDMISMTRVTSKSFYHYNREELVNKLLLIQDYDGLDEEAQYAFRELQSNGTISSSTTFKDRSGNIVSQMKQVKSNFSSLLATTKAEIYYDNMSRSVVIGVDESEEQTQRIIRYQNRKLAGLIDVKQEQQIKFFLQNCFRLIKPYEVVNYYADKITLPLEAKMLRRLNSHYQVFVKQITLLNQYQRKTDQSGRLIAEKEDLKIACDILFDAIMLKVDDLDASLRHFFDRVKIFIQDLSGGKNPGIEFTQRDVRLAMKISKTQCFRYFEELELLEYIQRTGGYANRGFKYRIVFWDDMEKIRQKIKASLNRQLAELNK